MSEESAQQQSLKEVWIVDEGSPGHLAQSKGLALALQEKLPEIEVTQLSVSRHFSGFQRAIIRRLMGRDGRSAPRFLEEKILATLKLEKYGDAPPDLIISSGGKSVFPACVLAKRYQAPYVFIGERKPYPSEWFHTVFTPSPREAGANDVAIDLIPTGVTPEKVAQAAASYDRPEGPLWAMIIGGSSRSHPYSAEDWTGLARGINVLAKRFGIRWLLTTSRRTGAEIERLLKSEIESEVLADAIWWATQPDKQMMVWLGSANLIFVTQDSVTMVTECVATGKAVVVLRPSKEKFPIKSFIPQYLKRLELKYGLSKLRMAQLVEEFELPDEPQTLSTGTPCSGMVETLLKRLE